MPLLSPFKSLLLRPSSHHLPAAVLLSPRQRPFLPYQDVRYTLQLLPCGKLTPIVFLSLTFRLYYYTLRMLTAAAPPLPLFGVMHGGLAELVPRRGRFARFIPRGLRSAMSLMAARQFRFIVLEAIQGPIADHRACHRENHAGRSPSAAGGCTTDRRTHLARRTHPYCLARLGNTQKGLFVFAECARRFDLTLPGQAEFHCIGRTHADALERIGPFLQYFRTRPASAPLPREQYRELLSTMHYACFFFVGGHYDLTASGALLDCIAAGLPIIGRRNALLESIESTFGPIGVLYDSEDPDAAVRRAIEVRPMPAYEAFRHNLQAAAAQRSALATRRQLASILPAAP